MRMKRRKKTKLAPWKSGPSKPGDTWGAYILHADGWWRLNPKWKAAATKGDEG